jgi:alpha-tubulin suppressor-like RCC1 family protein
MKADFDYTKSQLSIARDSVSILKRISNTQDLDIKVKESTISLYIQNESKYYQLLLNKDEEIDLFKKQLKKQKLSKRVIITIGVASLLFGVYKTL